MSNNVQLACRFACLSILIQLLRYFLNWIALDPGDIFIQTLQPINILDVVIGRNKATRSFSLPAGSVMSWVLEAAAAAATR